MADSSRTERQIAKALKLGNYYRNFIVSKSGGIGKLDAVMVMKNNLKFVSKVED